MEAASRLTSKSLSSLQEGDVAQIKRFANEKIASKLIAMGILPGHSLQLIRTAPFSGALYIKSGHYSFALRPQEAASIIISDDKI